MATCTNATIEDAFHVRPNADVSGPGVLTAFVATAYLTLVLIIAYYLLRCVDDDNLNALDRSILGWLWRKKPQASSNPRLKRAIEKTILTFSDQQLVTGLAILIAGFAQLRSSDTEDYIDVDHWQKMVFTAWFSSLTHLATLSVLRNYFKNQYRAARPVRIILMFCTIVFLLTALAPTAASNWLVYPAAPAICYFSPSGFEASAEVTSYSEPFGGSRINVVSVTISSLVLLVSYGTRVICLFDTPSQFFRRYAIEAPSSWLRLNLRKRDQTILSNVTWPIVYGTALVQIAIYRALRSIYTSFFWEILWLVYALLWGTIHLMVGNDTSSELLDVYYSSTLPGWVTQSANWAQFGFDGSISSFGQLLPLFLLVIPLFSAFELLSESDLEPMSPPAHPRMAQARFSQPSTPTGPVVPDFLDQDFHSFLWFRLYLAVAISMSFVVVIYFLLVFGGAFSDTSTALGIIEWIPTAVVYTEMYMLPCALLEKYRGCGRHGTTSRPPLWARVLMWLWALALLGAGVMSPLGLGFIPP